MGDAKPILKNETEEKIALATRESNPLYLGGRLEFFDQIVFITYRVAPLQASFSGGGGGGAAAAATAAGVDVLQLLARWLAWFSSQIPSNWP